MPFQSLCNLLIKMASNHGAPSQSWQALANNILSFHKVSHSLKIFSQRCNSITERVPNEFPIIHGFPVNVRSFHGMHSHSLGNLVVTISSTQATAVGPKLPSESSSYIHHNVKVTTNITFRHHFLCQGLEAHSAARTHPCTA